MFHWQSAWRLLIVTLALATPWPAFAQVGDAAESGVDVANDAAAGVDAADGAAPAKKRRDPSDWADLRNYVPSTSADVTRSHAGVTAAPCAPRNRT